MSELPWQERAEKKTEVLRPVVERAGRTAIQGILPTVSGRPFAIEEALEPYALGRNQIYLKWDSSGWGQHVDLHISITDKFEPEVTVNHGGTTLDPAGTIAFGDLVLQLGILAASLESELAQRCKWMRKELGIDG